MAVLVQFITSTVGKPVHQVCWKISDNQGNLKGESCLFLIPELTQWGGSHIDHHIWGRVIVSLDLVQSFGPICAHR